ncbi:hypothetical protein DS843_00770 [Roseomonas genomospecies 6]|uniref:Uncharacterized protein n=1 Tax=Roseomonas genomospecies 6 TaxID=214106 RepID=A0A9W7NNU6_9PROT|nr:hypothetical protein DS843_00770 [Roseomonas genomospecies 6]
MLATRLAPPRPTERIGGLHDDVEILPAGGRDVAAGRGPDGTALKQRGDGLILLLRGLAERFHAEIDLPLRLPQPDRGTESRGGNIEGHRRMPSEIGPLCARIR